MPHCARSNRTGRILDFEVLVRLESGERPERHCCLEEDGRESTDGGSLVRSAASKRRTTKEASSAVNGHTRFEKGPIIKRPCSISTSSAALYSCSDVHSD